MDELTTPTLPWWRRLVVQLVALVLAAAFLPLLIVGIGTIQTERSRAIQQARQANLAQAEGIAERVASHVRQAATELKVLAGSPPLRSGDWDAAWVELERLQSQYPDLAVLTLTDTAGDERVKVSATELVLPGSLGSRAQSPDFLAAMRGETYLGDLQFVTGAGQRLPVSVPVFDAARQEVIGVLSAELALRDLLETVSTTRAGQAGYAYIVDDGGRIVAHPDFSLVLAQADASAIPEIQDFLAGLQEWQEPEFSAYDSLVGEPVFGVHAPIGAPNWSVIVEQPAAEVLAQVRTLAVQFSFLWGVTMLLAAGLTVALTLFVAHPVSQLTRTAQRLAAGDRSARAPVRRQDEVGLLATSFNHMVESIQQAESQRDATLEALRESEEKYRGLVEGLGEAIYRMSLPDGKYEYLSPAVKKVFGYSAEEFLESPLLIREIIHPDFSEYFKEKWADLIEGKVPPIYEYKIFDPEGNERWIVQSNTGIFDDSGNIIAIEGICRDITERKRAEEELREYRAYLEELVEARTAELNERVAEVEGLNRAMTNLLNDLQASNRKLAETGQELQRANAELETFTYSVSHDLKAPLRGIDGYSRLLLQDHAGQLDDEGRTFLHTIRHAAEQMNQLINDLLAYSRLERRAMHTTSVDPRALVEALVAEHAAEMRERGVGLTVDVPCQAVMAEAEGLAQALRNLLDNALKFTRDAPGPRVEIGGRDTEKTCIIWVRDNGVGFDMLYHDRVFEIFQRLHRAEEYPGTGVGLAIVRKAMQRMGGRVWAESAPGEGATFYLEIRR